MASGREGAPEAGKDLVIISFNLLGCKNLQLQPHDLHICPYSHGFSCAFQPNAFRELDRSTNEKREVQSVAGLPQVVEGSPMVSRCIPMAQDRQSNYLIMGASALKLPILNDAFTVSALVGSHVQQSKHRPFSRADKKMSTFLFALCDSSCILTFAFNGELSEWPKEHDWKSCRRQKRLQGSNP